MTITILSTFQHFNLQWLIHVDLKDPDLYQVSSTTGKRLAGNFASTEGAKLGAEMLLDHLGETRVFEAVGFQLEAV